MLHTKFQENRSTPSNRDRLAQLGRLAVDPVIGRICLQCKY